MNNRIMGTGASIILCALCCLVTATAVAAQPASGRKPSLAVIEFEIRAQASRDAGRELREMLVNALLESQRFTIVDRSKMSLIQDEQLLALRGSVNQATGAKVGEMLGANFLVLGSVTEFSEKKTKGGALFSRIPGGNNLTSYQAIVKFNLTVVNSTTGELAFSKAVEKKVSSTGLGGDGAAFGVPMEGFESKAMQDAVGQAISELAGRDRNMTSSRARVEARAIQTDTARILAADGTHGSGLDITEFVSAKTALRNAGGLWADYFITQICQAPKPEVATSAAVEIMVSNVNYAQLKRFTDSVATIPGVRSVEKKLTDNVARVDVLYDGSAERLADAIAETKFGAMRVNIVGLSGNKIEVSVGR